MKLGLAMEEGDTGEYVPESEILSKPDQDFCAGDNGDGCSQRMESRNEGRGLRNVIEVIDEDHRIQQFLQGLVIATLSGASLGRPVFYSNKATKDNEEY